MQALHKRRVQPYDPCLRTVCQIEAAKLICANYSTSYAPKWELPTSSEVDIITKADNAIRAIGGKTSSYQYCLGLALGGNNNHKCNVATLATVNDTKINAMSVRCITRRVYK